MVWHEVVPTHKHGCWKGVKNLKFSAEMAVFLVVSGKKQISPLWAALEKLLNKSTNAPLDKNPSDAHAHKHINYTIFVKIVLYTPSGNTVQQYQCDTPSHSRMTDCARCVLPNNYEIC